MRRTLRELLAILSATERRALLPVLLLLCLAAALDTLGVASIMPFVQLAVNPSEVNELPVLGDLRASVPSISDESFVALTGVGVLAVLLAALGLRGVSHWAQVMFTARSKHSLAVRLLRRHLGRSYEWFLSQHSSQLSIGVLDEAGRVVEQSLFPLLQMLANGLVVLFLLTFLVLIDPVLALGALVLLGGGYLLVFVALRRINESNGARRQRARRDSYRLVQEAFGGFKDLKLMGLESSFERRFDGPSWEAVRTEGIGRILSEMPRFAMQGIVFSAMVLAVVYVLLGRGDLQAALPSLAGFAFAGYRLLPSLQSVYAQLTKLRFGAPTLTALHDDLCHEGENPDDEVSGRDGPEHVGRSVSLREITYRYPAAATPAVDDVSLVIPARSSLGIIGSTGSGKTTLVDVLLGLLVPQQGWLEVDGCALTNRGQLRYWQDLVGYVPQTIYLADESVAANIAFGVPVEEIDMEAVERAARAANVHDFIIDRLPQGYETAVGERGVRLSGGQRQRMGIARALYRDPDVLVLDEATSALDGVTEAAVMEAIQNLGGKKTVVLIAHRLGTVRYCDRIAILDRGRCVDVGSWDELVDRNERFRDMVRLSA